MEYGLDRAKLLGFDVMGPSIASERGAAIALAAPNSHALEQTLMQRGIIASARGPAIRLAPHFFTLEEDIETALQELKKLM